MRKINWVGLVSAVIGIEIIGNIGSFATFNQITTWYATVTKPSFNPPNWLFGPVWTILFALLGVALYFVWESRHQKRARTAITLFMIQMALNVVWSFLFFGWHQIGAAFMEIVVLWAAILMTLLAFWRIKKEAGWLLVPYLAWVTFAALLNFAVWRLN